MPHPDGLPDVFVDRSLGRIRVPQLLRDAGLRLITLAERYGIPADDAGRIRARERVRPGSETGPDLHLLLWSGRASIP